MNNATSSNTPKIVGLVLGLVIIAAALVWAFMGGKAPMAGDENATTTPEGPATVPAAPVEGTTPTPSSGTYKDGTYTAAGSYVSPAGQESVNVGITLKGDVITDATFQGTATNPASKNKQAAFASAYKQQVVGKSISEVSLSVVNGASLTPKGFMDALAKIEAQAKS